MISDLQKRTKVDIEAATSFAKFTATVHAVRTSASFMQQLATGLAYHQFIADSTTINTVVPEILGIATLTTVPNCVERSYRKLIIF